MVNVGESFLQIDGNVSKFTKMSNKQLLLFKTNQAWAFKLSANALCTD